MTRTSIAIALLLTACTGENPARDEIERRQAAERAREEPAPGGAAWTCPMCPGVRAESAGDCPVCGMPLERSE